MSDLAITASGRLANAATGASEQQRLRQAARQFEALVMTQLMNTQVKEEGDEESELDDSNASRQFRQMFNGALSEQSAGGLGLADTLVASLTRELALRNKPAATPAPAGGLPGAVP